jgi:hypothetical protein
MKRIASLFYLICILLFSTLSVSAHPSYGLVVTETGNVIFCDVLHNSGTIWMLDRQGKLSKILTGEHCHFIFMDRHSNIWGTNHEYLPDTDNNRNTLWKLHPSQEKQIVIPPTTNPKEFSGVNFVVDGQENIYFDVDGQLYIRREKEGPRLFLPHRFGRIISLQTDEDGNIYVVDNNEKNGTVFKVTPEKEVIALAGHLLERPPPDPPFPNPLHNMLFATFIAPGGNVYVANSGSRRITLIKNDGSVEHLYHSEAPWYPVAFYQKDGIDYIMENSFVPGEGNFGPRIIRVEAGKKVVLVDVDKPPREKSDTQEKKGNSGGGKEGNLKWWFGLAAVLLCSVLANRLIKRR